jgi:glycosyltransferase involved in cell wall biosynthesis
MPTDRSALAVLLCTQGSYPLTGGGVTTWCDQLCRGLPETAFEVYAVTEKVPAKASLAVPANVRRVMQVGQQGDLAAPHWLWGFSPEELPGRRQARPGELEGELVPRLRVILELLGRDQGSAEAGAAAGATLVELHRLFRVLAWGEVWRCGEIRGAFAAEAQRLWSDGWGEGVVGPGPSRHDLAQSLGWLRRFLSPLQAPLPAAGLVHATSAGPCVVLGVVAKIERAIPFLLTEHGLGVREVPFRPLRSGPFVRRLVSALYRLWARVGYHHADAITTVSALNRDWQIELGADPRKITVVPNGVPCDRSSAGAGPAPPAASSGRRRVVVVSAAAVRPIKDLETLIRAAAVVTRQLAEARFRVHGPLDDRAYAARCDALIRELGLGAAFTLEGWSDDRDAIYRDADVAVLSSVSEGHPFALLEAMARGVPVVATRAGGVPDLVGEAGWLVPPRDPESLAAAVLTLLRDPARRSELGRAGRTRVAERFSTERMVAAYRTLYADVAAVRAPR